MVALKCSIVRNHILRVTNVFLWGHGYWLIVKERLMEIMLTCAC